MPTTRSQIKQAKQEKKELETEKKEKASKHSQIPAAKKRKLDEATLPAEKEKSEVKKFDLLSRSAQPVSRENRRLDGLARLLEGNNICTAVCIVNDEILVTTNVLKAYQEPRTISFNNNASVELMENILTYFLKIAAGENISETDRFECLFKICSNRIKVTHRSGEPETQIRLDEELLRKLIVPLYNSYPDIEAGYWAIMDAAADDLYKMGFLNETEKDLWLKKSDPAVRRDFSKDIRFISEKISQIKAANRFLWHLIHDFKKNEEFFKVEWKTIRTCKILAVGEEKEHAEARMIGYLLETGNLKPADTIYIGISKLCCACCAGIVYAVNDALGTNMGIMYGTSDHENKLVSSQEDLEECATNKAIEESDEDNDVLAATKREIPSEEKKEPTDESSIAISIRGTHGIYNTRWMSKSKYLQGGKYLPEKGFAVRCIGKSEEENRTEIASGKNRLTREEYNQIRSSFNAMKKHLTQIVAKQSEKYEKLEDDKEMRVSVDDNAERDNPHRSMYASQSDPSSPDVKKQEEKINIEEAIAALDEVKAAMDISGVGKTAANNPSLQSQGSPSP
ncbi:MAG: hypothetical protein K0R24_33 [Gammaproteobacteria bacterium]|jgi:hypothetical protein|nr:hypothetical protein [Gammaproteobacteria bacterium]